MSASYCTTVGVANVGSRLRVPRAVTRHTLVYCVEFEIAIDTDVTSKTGVVTNAVALFYMLIR